MAPYQRVQIFGKQGRVEIEIPFNAPPDRPCKLWLQTSAGIEEFALPVCNQYTIQGDLFSQAILEDTAVPTPIEDAVANMRVIEALVRSAESGRWEMP
jgi:predicted dehydrogenase